MSFFSTPRAPVESFLQFAREGLRDGCEADSPPPLTDRVVTHTETPKDGAVSFKVDWWAGSVWAPLDVVLRVVAVQLLGCHSDDEDHRRFFEVLSHGGRGFKGIQRAGAVTVYSDPIRGGDYCHVEVKGAALAAVSLDELRCFWHALSGLMCRWQTARVDLTWDGCPFTPAQVDDAIERGAFRAWVKRDEHGWSSWHRERRGASPKDPDQPCGSSAYLGSRESPRHVVVYDGRGFTRLEFRNKDDWATAAVDALAALPVEAWSAFSLGLLRKFCDFLDGGDEDGGDSNRSRRSGDERSLAPWWRAFIGDAKKMGGVVCRRSGEVVREVRSKIRQIGRSARAVLWAASETYGLAWVGRQMAQAAVEAVHGSRERSLVERLRADVSRCADDLGLSVDFSEPDGQGLACRVWESLFPPLDCAVMAGR